MINNRLYKIYQKKYKENILINIVIKCIINKARIYLRIVRDLGEKYE